MGILISASDFIGENKIATDVFTDAELDNFITLYESKLLYELLGIELYILFIADLIGGVPQTAKYVTIYDAFVKEIDNEMITSDGMKVMLVKWVFFHYVRTQPQTNTIQGNTQSEGTINMPSAMSYTSLVIDYNKMILTFKAIQTYIESVKDADYPTFKGVYKNYMSWA
jgi:hypothetical protein